MRQTSLTAIVLSLALLLATGHALAADKVRLGKAVASSFPMSIADLGAAEGIFAREGLELEITALTGDAKLQQAFAASSIDMGLGSGPAMAFTVKGAPTVAVAVFAGPPATIAAVVLPQSPIETVADLKGKRMGVSTTGSLTEWLVKRLSVHQGWGPAGISTVALGAGSAMNGALFTKDVDAIMTGTENAFLLVDKRQARILTGMEGYAPDFMTHVIFARKDFAASHPDQVGRFVKGFFTALHLAKSDRAKTIAFMAPLLNEPPQVLGQVYDHELGMLSDDGHFDPKALAVLKQSFVDMGILETQPSDDELLTTRFVPVKP